ncbi:two-component system response regulator BtsR [Shewanella mesophila]|uniref:two-component system response regulator BtsR n=1 Tax=Shewanella mesophila TaxID=2864208 RepID=UPI001C654E6C|nr:two-component system response regulator BtsR [Shewanella mesophila]QYJ84788.1 two-component system response regulator BtsR [Shewanella mesophila]
MITCLIIDDEPFARESLSDLLSVHQDIDVIDHCCNAIEAMQSIAKYKPELIFVDIQMPKISGLEMVAMLDPDTMPKVVFVTAYDEYAIKAFDNHAFDYLLKPIDEARLQTTIERIRKEQVQRSLAAVLPTQLEHVPCYCGNRLKVINVDDVEFAFSDLTGIHVTTSQEQVHTHLTLKVLEEKTELVRCHKQYLVAPHAISEIIVQENGAEIVTHSGKQIPVSRRFLKPLKQIFGFS